MSGLLLFSQAYYLYSTIMLLVAVIIFTTSYGLEVDTKQKEVLDYLAILGIKNGKKMPYEKLEKVYMTQSKKTTKMQLRAASNTHRSAEYNGYIKISELNKIHLLSDKNKGNVEAILRKMSVDLGVDYEDHSQE